MSKNSEIIEKQQSVVLGLLDTIEKRVASLQEATDLQRCDDILKLAHAHAVIVDKAQTLTRRRGVVMEQVPAQGANERTWAVYALVANRPAEESHDLRFLGTIGADEHGPAQIFNKRVDELVERVTRDWPRSSEQGDTSGWATAGWEAVACWPEDELVQVNEPGRRPLLLGYQPSVRSMTARF